MRITTRGRYALRAMLQLAKHAPSPVLSVKQISEETQISYEFLEQLLVKLKRANLVASVRGPGGGYMLSRSAAEISVKDIFDAVGEVIDLTNCHSCKVSELVCASQNGCESHLVWKGATEHLIEFFTNLSLQDVLEGKTPIGI
jgi:Rrf2 family iron-sulfur cluster assembly transcriptional regulator